MQFTAVVLSTVTRTRSHCLSSGETKKNYVTNICLQVLWHRWKLAWRKRDCTEAIITRPSGSAEYTPDAAQNSIAVVAAVFCCVAVPVSRVVLGYHTVEQVVVGSACGFLCGCAWAWIILGPIGRVANEVCIALRLPQFIGLTSYLHCTSASGAMKSADTAGPKRE